MTTNATSILSCVTRNSAPCNCVQLCYILDPNISSILIIMMENNTILTMETYHFPKTNYNISSDLCLIKVFADQSETKVNCLRLSCRLFLLLVQKLCKYYCWSRYYRFIWFCICWKQYLVRWIWHTGGWYPGRIPCVN
jgi:hypothetical protein